MKTGGRGGLDEYGYWWWIDPEAHVAVGLGGQVIAVVPDQDLVVVFTGAVPERLPFALLRRCIVPAVRAARLAPLPAVERALSALERELETPPPRPPSPVHPAADRISRAPFLLEPNPLGFTALHLRCADPRDCAMELRSPRETRVLPVGLDDRYRVTGPASAEDLPVACKGAWLDSATPTFALTPVQLGEPVHLDVRLACDGDRAAVTVVRRSFDVRTMRFEGTQAPVKPRPARPARQRPQRDERGQRGVAAALDLDGGPLGQAAGERPPGRQLAPLLPGTLHRGAVYRVPAHLRVSRDACAAAALRRSA